MSFKRTKVVMLSTNEKAEIGTNVIVKHNTTLAYGKKVQEPYNMVETEQHLYFLSNEEIKEGDWFLPISGIGWVLNIPIQADGEGGYNNEHCKKIIATTDKLRLIAKDEFGGIDCQHLPQPSNSFIEKFVEAYNSGKPITEVMVEYNEVRSQECPSLENPFTKCTCGEVKVNPKDNTITIKKVKDIFTRDEVINLFKLRENTIHNYNTEEDWIEENL